MTALPNLQDLEVEWAEFMANRPGPRNATPGWSQDQKWRADNPGKQERLLDYRAGGARPDFSASPIGSPERRMVANISAWLLAKGTPDPEPQPGTLPHRPPPGWNGNEPEDYHSFPSYEVHEVKRDGTVPLTNGKDHVLLVDADYSGGGRIWCQGGRHIVAIAGEVDYANTSGDGFNSSFQFEGGDDGGQVFVEGFRVKNQPNGFTLKAPKLFTFQNIHCDLRDGSGQGHPDVIQVWSGYKAKGIRVARMSGWSAFTYLSDFVDDGPAASFGRETPAFWDLRDVDMHPVGRSNSLNIYMGSPQHAVWRGTNCWWETSFDPSGTLRDLGDQLRQYGLQYQPYGPNGTAAQFEILDVDGTAMIYRSPVNPQVGTPDERGSKQGQWLRYIDNPRLANIMWRAGKPTVADGADPSGMFVPASLVGRGYKSPGYVAA